MTLLACYIAALLLSAIIHEQWHARVALWMGDPTARDMGRLSWNPAVHLDPFMSFLLPVITFFTMGFAFGGAKPVMINANNFRNPSLGMCLSAAAGPVSNLVLGAIGFLFMVGLHAVAPSFLYVAAEKQVTINALFLAIFVFVNLMLGCFNLLPIPGLDGSRVLRHLLPAEGRRVMDALEPYSLFIIVIAVNVGVGRILAPVFGLLKDLFEIAFGPVFYETLKDALNIR